MQRFTTFLRFILVEMPNAGYYVFDQLIGSHAESYCDGIKIYHERELCEHRVDILNATARRRLLVMA